jgi:hypothetical protein
LDNDGRRIYANYYDIFPSLKEQVDCLTVHFNKELRQLQLPLLCNQQFNVGKFSGTLQAKLYSILLPCCLPKYYRNLVLKH